MDAYDQLTPIIAHRGASASAPENTLAAIQAAYDQGAGWVELDIAVTSDHVPVIFHDSQLHRTTNGQGLLLKTCFADIKDLDAGSWFAPEFSEQRIPTLEQAILEIQRLGMGLNLEIKPTVGWDVPTVEAMAPVLKQHWKNHQPLILSSYSQEALIRAKELLPEYPRGLNVDAIPGNWQERLKIAECSGLHCHYPFVDQDLIHELHEAKKKVLTFTVNDAQMATILFKQGVNGIFTDKPLEMINGLSIHGFGQEIDSDGLDGSDQVA